MICLLSYEDLDSKIQHSFSPLPFKSFSLPKLALLLSGGYGGSHSPVAPPQAPLQQLTAISPPLLPGPPQSPPLQCNSGGSYPPVPTQGPPYSARQPPVVYTAATFAQTKFGSTKLKTNSKKPNRMSPTEFSNYIKQRAMQKSLQQGSGNFQQQQQGNGFYDKFYSPSSYSGNSNSSNMNNFNNFPKSPSGGANDYNNFGLGSGLNINSSGGFSSSNAGLSLSDYSSLLSDWPESCNDLDTNAFLQDILSSAGVSGSGPAGTSKNQFSRGYDDWASAGLGFNANHGSEQGGLGPESRSSSTKSMSSGSEHSLPSPPGLQGEGREGREGFLQHRVLVAN